MAGKSTPILKGTPRTVSARDSELLNHSHAHLGCGMRERRGRKERPNAQTSVGSTLTLPSNSFNPSSFGGNNVTTCPFPLALTNACAIATVVPFSEMVSSALERVG